MQPGERIGKYVVEAQLGEGGNGAVYAARDAILGRRVALKILHPEMLYDATIAARFRQEAQAMAQLSHPNVVIVHDFVSDETRWALVMELIENGETLSSLIKRSGRLPVARALRLISQTASALGHAHRRGIVHRDVKPANVMVIHGEQGELAKLTDFGIARIIHGERRTQAALTLGTLWYLAPEQAQNSAVDARADVYALGCSIYEALTGRVPFPYDNVARVLASHVSEPPRPLSELVPGIPADVDALVARCLAKNPYDRPRDGEELRVLLDDVLARLEPPRSPSVVGSMPPRGSSGTPTPAPAHPSYPTPTPAGMGPASVPSSAPRPADFLGGFVPQPSAHAVVASTQVMPGMGDAPGASVAAPPPAAAPLAVQAAQQAADARERRLGLWIGSGALALVVLTCGFGMLLCILTGMLRCG
jgi:serine/threonine protein kinase